MPYQVERRKYQRCHSVICKAQMSLDEKHWVNTDFIDLSAGGLSFASDDARLKEGTRIFFNLYVYNMLSEFNIKMEGSIIRVDNRKAKGIYSVKFENINKYHQIQLDELVKSKVSLYNIKHEPVYQEEYSTLLFPGIKPKTNKIKLINYK